MNTNGLVQIPSFLYILIIVWSLAWKGVALWKASKFDQKFWFVALLVINIVGILEIVYLFFFAKKKLKIKDLQFWKQL